MKRWVAKVCIGGLMVVTMTACEIFRGPDKTGEIELSSELFGTETYYLFGYHYEDGTYYRYRFQGDKVPDIINEGMRILQGGEVAVLPQFESPNKGERIGFALIGQYPSLEEGKAAYNAYKTVGSDLQFGILSDTVELYQLWVQRTNLGNYVKMLVKDIVFSESESGNKYCEVIMDYTYQPNGSSAFPE